MKSIQYVSNSCSNEYRFGFNGKEKDKETYGEGNEYDFGARIYNPRIGRWLSLDPLMEKYPDLSPYSFVANSPLLFIDKDGREIFAHDAASQELVLKTVNYLFGDSHGFSFQNNKLVHNGNELQKMTSSQSLVYKYFMETLVKSETPVTFRANTKSLVVKLDDKNSQIVQAKDGGASTYDIPGFRKFEYLGNNLAPTITVSIPNRVEILVPQSTTINGTNVDTQDGSTTVSPEYVSVHEFGHAMVNVIMNEYGGKFNDVDFKQMSEQQRLDWTIKFSNTINKDNGNPQETGKGQHNRKLDEKPDEKMDTLTK